MPRPFDAAEARRERQVKEPNHLMSDTVVNATRLQQELLRPASAQLASRRSRGNVSVE